MRPSAAFRRVPLPSQVDVVVRNSGVVHSNRGSGYGARRAECEAACAALSTHSLRELGMADPPRFAGPPEPFGRHARHDLTET
jgi:galactokinase